MNFYKDIETWFNQGLWTKTMVVNAVLKNKITAEQYKEITGEELELN